MNKDNPVIGQFNDSYPPIIDGVAITVQQYAYGLHRMGKEVAVITPKAPDYTDSDPFPVLRYQSLPLLTRKPYRLGLPDIDPFYQRDIEKIPFTLVHAHCPFTSGLQALKIAREREIPFVASFHTKYRDNFEQTIKSKKIVNLMVEELVRFYEHAEEVWIPQEAVEDTLREYGYKGKIVVMNNGNDFIATEPPAALKKHARQKLGIREDEKILLYVGQLVWEKNIRLIVESLEKIKERNFKMFFVGTGYAADELKKLTFVPGLQDKVFFPGIISDRALLRDYYAAADLFLFPSLYDTWAIVVREAAALYTPSVMINRSIAASQLTDNFNGFLVENNSEDLSARLSTLLNQPDKLTEAGKQAALTLTKSWEKVTEEVWERYQRLM